MNSPLARFNHALAKGFAPRKPTTVSQWADGHRILSSKGSAEPGRWRTNRNPPLREPEDIEALRQALKDGTIDCIATEL